MLLGNAGSEGVGINWKSTGNVAQLGRTELLKIIGLTEIAEFMPLFVF